jgi:hypothetical protein
LAEDIRILAKPILVAGLRRELRKLSRRRCTNQQIAWWIKGFYRALQLVGGLSPEIQQLFDSELKKIEMV